MVPSAIFKRPGPHHAYEADVDKLAKLRAAIDVLEELGIADPLSALTGRAVESLLAESLFSSIAYYAVSGDDFGLQNYGPMLRRAGLQTTWGGPLIETRDPRVVPISQYWADRCPYLPQQIATATSILDRVVELRDPPAQAWDMLLAALTDDASSDDDRRSEKSPPALIATWKREYVAELEAFRAAVVKIAARGGSVITWEDEQGWL